MSFPGAGFAVALLAATAGCSTAAQRPDLHYSFDRDTDGWFAYGGNASVRVIREGVKAGSGALALDYVIAPDEYGSAVVAVPEGALANARSFRFWVKSDLPTAVALVLSERAPNGGTYSAWFWSPKDTWQRIHLAPADFAANEGPADPVDRTGRLDRDQIQGIGIIDLGQAFQTLRDPDLPIVIDQHKGSHTLTLDDFSADAQAPPSPKPGTIGRLDRGFLTWVTMGGASLSIDAGKNPLGKSALKWEYNQPPGEYVVITHGFAGTDLRGADRLTFDIASRDRCDLVVYLEERSPRKNQGPRYKLVFEIPGDGRKVEKTVRFADFTLDSTGPAGKPQVDPARLKAISVMDGTATTARRENTVWISELTAPAGPAR